MKYQILTSESNSTQNYNFKKKVNILKKATDRNINYNISHNNDLTLYKTSLRKTITLFEINYSNEREKLLFMSFINQRKVHRYYKSMIEYENNEITEQIFDEIEDSCVLTVERENESVISSKLIYLYDLMKKYAPEEINFMTNEDLADILSISENKINKLHYRITDE